jgi:hypothetical protein
MPIWPVRSTAGSVATPYIFDDKVDFRDVTPLIHHWYNMSKEERRKAGMKGRQWMLSDDGQLSLGHMCSTMVNGMESAWSNWKPRKKYELFEIA